jgi:hypothetical protein
MKSILAVILIVAALVFAYLGIDTLRGSGASVDILGVEIEAQDQGARQTAYAYLGIAAICLICGVWLVRGSK